MRLIAILLTLTSAAWAQDLIFLKDGSVFHGDVEKSDWDSVTIKRTDGTTITVAAEDCESHFFYRVRDKALEDDAKGRIRLAKYAVDHDMFSRAKAQMDLARTIDPAVVEEFKKTRFPEIREGLAQKLLHATKRAKRRGSTKNTKKYASIILTKLEGTKAEAEAEKLFDEAVAKEHAEAERIRNQRRRNAEQLQELKERQAAQQRESMIGPIEKLLDDGGRIENAALKGKNMSQTTNNFATAAARYKSAGSKAKAALKNHPDDETLQALLKEANEREIGAYLHSASVYGNAGSFKKAHQMARLALNVDPNNADAKAALANYSTVEGNWPRRRGGRRR